MRDYNKLLEAGNKAQLEKLKENEHKEDWESMPFEYKCIRLHEEHHEFTDELIAINRDYAKIRHEAADIANFAHMIILACDKEINQ